MLGERDNSISERRQQQRLEMDAPEIAGGEEARESAKGGCGMLFKGLCRLERWKHPTSLEARTLEWLSVIVTVITTSFGIGFAIAGNSAIMLAYGLEAFVDIGTCFVLLWRFSGPASEEKQHSQSREERAQAAIGIAFVVTGAIVLIDALVHLANDEETMDRAALLAISIISCFTLLALAILKVYVARALDSTALYEDGLAGFGSAALSLSVIISVSVEANNPGLWWLDAFFAVLISLAFLAFGAYILRPLRFYSAQFWRTPKTQRVDLAEFGDDSLQPLDMDMI